MVICNFFTTLLNPDFHLSFIINNGLYYILHMHDNYHKILYIMALFAKIVSVEYDQMDLDYETFLPLVKPFP
jgi:hypothetical protein